MIAAPPKRPLPSVQWSGYGLIYFMQISAEKCERFLKEYGIRCRIIKRSRSICEEPYVEWTWEVQIDDGTPEEKSFIKRVVANWKGGQS